ncbi:MAG: hypothetical protein JXQ72_16050 [Anaerolineae bacterium]|nr:hypothetical protein [Anaerolineae bacterium]
MSSGKNKPHVQRGKRRIPSLPGEYHSVEMRSQLEIHFAQELTRRDITWRYEPERIGPGHYLVDFYLPDLKCWVEVKGRFDSRESLLLPNVALNLKRDRGERLFLYMKDRAYLVGPRHYQELTHDELWDAIQNPPPDAGQPPDDDPGDNRRRVWRTRR